MEIITTSEAREPSGNRVDEHEQDGDAEVAGEVRKATAHVVGSWTKPCSSRMPSGRRAIAASMSGSTFSCIFEDVGAVLFAHGEEDRFLAVSG